MLTVAQAFMMSMNSLNVFVGGLIGKQLAPNEKLATLPVAVVIVGTAVFSVPLTLAMRKYGRKNVFLFVGGYSILMALLASFSISQENFYFYVACMFMMGLTSASIMQFRFASMESVKTEYLAKAASYVLLGGIAAAFIGPEVALLGRNLFATEFTGSYVLLGGLFVLGLLMLMLYENTEMVKTEQLSPPRSLWVIASQRVFWVAILGATIGYAVMAFIMTATPVSMHVMDGHSLGHTKVVIQSHIVAMFLPSLITGTLIKRFGIANIMVVGLIAYLICIGIAFMGHNVHNYWGALVLLGIGWNFLFVGGTSLLPQAYQENERFRVQAFNEFFLFSSQAIASLSAGWIVFALGWEWMLALTLPFILIQFVMIGFWKMKGS